MNDKKLLEELNQLIENILCPMDLMDSIDEYVRINILEVLNEIKNGKINLEETIYKLDFDKRFEDDLKQYENEN
tara:strand:- start:295 stop:516 length:222 start_codon:yes stop_codon:yes gene_type:complete